MVVNEFADIDECLEDALLSINSCENVKNSLCVNNEGSFDCNCAQGYDIVNDTCLSKLISSIQFKENKSFTFICYTYIYVIQKKKE